MANSLLPDRRRHALLLASLALSAGASTVFAQAKQPNLDPNFPVQIEDAYPVAYQTAYIKFVGRYAKADNATDLTTLAPEVAWGFAPNFDVHLVSTNLVGDGNRTGSGDLNLNAQWMFLEEKEGEWWPAAAFEADAIFPTGVGSDGIDVIGQGILTKTLTRGETFDAVHLNLTYTHNFVPNQDQRSEAYNVIAGYSRLLTPTTVFVTDVLWEKTLTEHFDDFQVEVGLIQSLGEHVKIAGGVGTGIGGDAPDYTATLAIIISN